MITNVTGGADATTTDSQIKKSSVEYQGFSDYTGEEEQQANVDGAAASYGNGTATAAERETASDPTMTHAGLSELSAPQATQVPQQDQAHPNLASSGNAAAETWNNEGSSNDNTATPSNGASEEALDESFEMVPRNPTEAEHAPEPAAQTMTDSWAHDVNKASAPRRSEGEFHQVDRRGGGSRGGSAHGQGRGRGRGGRGGRGGPRGGGEGGRGGRGTGSGGRGRGGPRGGAPAS